jgi:hypothetical protein
MSCLSNKQICYLLILSLFNLEIHMTCYSCIADVIIFGVVRIFSNPILGEKRLAQSLHKYLWIVLCLFFLKAFFTIFSVAAGACCFSPYPIAVPEAYCNNHLHPQFIIISVNIVNSVNGYSVSCKQVIIKSV